MYKDLVVIEAVYIKLNDKRHKSVIFLHNGNRESILISTKSQIKVGDKIEYDYLLKQRNIY